MGTQGGVRADSVNPPESSVCFYSLRTSAVGRWPVHSDRLRMAAEPHIADPRRPVSTTHRRPVARQGPSSTAPGKLQTLTRVH